MNLLVIVPDYPRRNHPFAGAFNERSVIALREHCRHVEVLAPRPYAPPVLSSLVPRWTQYRDITRTEVRHGVRIERPAYLQIPKIGNALCIDPGTYYWCRATAKRMHQRSRFDAIISFDLLNAGGLAWRLGRELGIPACGWATGSDVRFPASSFHGRIVRNAVKRLDIVFYQSRELMARAGELLGNSATEMSSDRHVVLPRGIEPPPALPRSELRNQYRRQCGIKDDQIVVMNVGRVLGTKGIFELIDAMALAVCKDPRLVCIVLGSNPNIDETSLVQRKLKDIPLLKERFHVLPSCAPGTVWNFLSAADIFAFTSYREGMPNSLLEAMAMGLPSIAFAIPPVVEIDAGTGALRLAPPFNASVLSNTIVELAASPDERVRLSERGKARVMETYMVTKSTEEAVQRLRRLLQQRTERQSVKILGANRREQEREFRLKRDSQV